MKRSQQKFVVNWEAVQNVIDYMYDVLPMNMQSVGSW